MDYPDDFDTPAFPAGTRIAVSRFMGVAVCAMFVAVIFMCFIILWAVRSQRVDPFVVSVNEFTGEWTVVGHSHGNGPLEYPAVWALQQSVIADFAQDWFTLSDDEEINSEMWATCDRLTDCGVDVVHPYGDKTCALYCLAGEELFSAFVYDIVPDYQARVADGETWSVSKTDFQIEPAGQISEYGGTWKILAVVKSNMYGDMKIVAFAKVARNTNSYPQTLGYYVADFNAYKVN